MKVRSFWPHPSDYGMFFPPYNRWAQTLLLFSVTAPLASFLWSSLSIFSKILQWLATLLQLQDFKLWKSKIPLTILDMAMVFNRDSQYLPLYLIQEQDTPVWLQGNPRKSLMQHCGGWGVNVLLSLCWSV